MTFNWNFIDFYKRSAACLARNWWHDIYTDFIELYNFYLKHLSMWWIFNEIQEKIIVQCDICNSGFICATGRWGFDSRQGQGFLLFFTTSRPALGPLSLISSGYCGFSLWLLGHEADISPPFSAEVKNAWTYTSTPPYPFMAWCLIKHGMVLSEAQGRIHLYLYLNRWISGPMTEIAKKVFGNLEYTFPSLLLSSTLYLGIKQPQCHRA
jgi:hypothetical protein